MFTQLKMMASIKYEAYGGPRQALSVLSATYTPSPSTLPSPFSASPRSQTHYRQEAIVALLSPRTKQKKETEVTPSIISCLGNGFSSWRQWDRRTRQMDLSRLNHGNREMGSAKRSSRVLREECWRNVPLRTHVARGHFFNWTLSKVSWGKAFCALLLMSKCLVLIKVTILQQLLLTSETWLYFPPLSPQKDTDCSATSWRERRHNVFSDLCLARCRIFWGMSKTRRDNSFRCWWSSKFVLQRVATTPQMSLCIFSNGWK